MVTSSGRHAKLVKNHFPAPTAAKVTQARGHRGFQRPEGEAGRLRGLPLGLADMCWSRHTLRQDLSLVRGYAQRLGNWAGPSAAARFQQQQPLQAMCPFRSRTGPRPRPVLALAGPIQQRKSGSFGVAPLAVSLRIAIVEQSAMSGRMTGGTAEPWASPAAIPKIFQPA